MSTRLATRLVQLGAWMLFLGVVAGAAIPMTRVPRLALSVHVTVMILGAMLVGYGLVWPRLRLGATAEKAAFWLVCYGAASNFLIGVTCSLLGIGGSTLTMAAGPQNVGSPGVEAVVKALLGTMVLATLAGTALVAWGTHGMAAGAE